MTQPDYKGLVETMISKIERTTFILPLNVTVIILYGQHSLHVQVPLLALALSVTLLPIQATLKFYTKKYISSQSLHFWDKSYKYHSSTRQVLCPKLSFLWKICTPEFIYLFLHKIFIDVSSILSLLICSLLYWGKQTLIK